MFTSLSLPRLRGKKLSTITHLASKALITGLLEKMGPGDAAKQARNNQELGRLVLQLVDDYHDDPDAFAQYGEPAFSLQQSPQLEQPRQTEQPQRFEQSQPAKQPQRHQQSRQGQTALDQHGFTTDSRTLTEYHSNEEMTVGFKEGTEDQAVLEEGDEHIINEEAADWKNKDHEEEGTTPRTTSHSSTPEEQSTENTTFTAALTLIKYVTI